MKAYTKLRRVNNGAGTYTELAGMLACRSNVDGSCDVAWNAVDALASPDDPDIEQYDFCLFVLLF